MRRVSAAGGAIVLRENGASPPERECLRLRQGGLAGEADWLVRLRDFAV